MVFNENDNLLTDRYYLQITWETFSLYWWRNNFRKPNSKLLGPFLSLSLAEETRKALSLKKNEEIDIFYLEKDGTKVYNTLTAPLKKQHRG